MANALKKIDDSYTEAYASEKAALDARHTAGTISEKSYRQGLLELNHRYSREIIETQLANLGDLVKLFPEGSEAAQKLIEKIAELRKKLSEGISAKPTRGVIGWTDEDLKLFDEVKTEIELYARSLKGIGDLFDAASQKRIQAWEDEIAAIERVKDADIDNARISIGNADEKEKAIAVISQRAAQQEENIARKVREEKHNQAVRDKEIALAEIVIKTALAVVNQLGAGDPYSAIPRAIAVGVLGGIEFAVAAAQPIPAYKMGVKDSGERGLAWVGDGGQKEVIETKDGAFITPAVPTLIDLPAHSVVHKTVDDYIKEAQSMTMRGMGVMKHVDERGIQSLEKALDKQTLAIVNAVRNAPAPGLSITGSGIHAFVQRGLNRMDYLKNI